MQLEMEIPLPTIRLVPISAKDLGVEEYDSHYIFFRYALRKVRGTYDGNTIVNPGSDGPIFGEWITLGSVPAK
jgi:hypothetical protein